MSRIGESEFRIWTLAITSDTPPHPLLEILTKFDINFQLQKKFKILTKFDIKFKMIKFKILTKFKIKFKFEMEASILVHCRCFRIR